MSNKWHPRAVLLLQQIVGENPSSEAVEIVADALRATWAEGFADGTNARPHDARGGFIGADGKHQNKNRIE